MRGINRVVISGNVAGSAINYRRTDGGSSALSFRIASDRHDLSGDVVTAWVKVNVYIEQLIKVCEQKLKGGGYVIVEGELMNRDGQRGQLTEVRAWEIVFIGR